MCIIWVICIIWQLWGKWGIVFYICIIWEKWGNRRLAHASPFKLIPASPPVPRLNAKISLVFFVSVTVTKCFATVIFLQAFESVHDDFTVDLDGNAS